MHQKCILLLIIFLIPACSYLPEDDVSGRSRVIDDPDYFLYYSGKATPGKAFLMVPGGLVDPLVYECWIDKLVQSDTSIAVAVVRYPSNLAITNSKKILRVREELDEIKEWIIGGHSLGGVVSSILVNGHSDLFAGMALMASWPPASTDLSDWSGSVLSIYASEDGLSTPEEIGENAVLLPPGAEILLPDEIAGAGNTTYYYEVEGGNHSGFGCYGQQEGDGEASISATEQQDQLVEVLLSFFDSVW